MQDEPNTEMVLSSLEKISSVLRVVNNLYVNNKANACLCIHGALLVVCDERIRQFIRSVMRWIDRTEKEFENGVSEKNLEKKLEDFYIMYSESIIKDAGTELTTEKNQTARVPYEALEILSEKQLQKIVEAHSVTKRAQTLVSEVSPKEDFPNSELVLSSLSEISSIFRVANEFYSINPHIAFLCFRGALKEALLLEHIASGRVRLFMTSVISWIETYDNEIKETISKQRERLKHPSSEKFLESYKSDMQNLTKQEDVPDSDLVISSLAEISPMLSVANEFQSSDPRIAYLCCYGAFDKARVLDKDARARGVRQFMNSFMNWIYKNDKIAAQGILDQSDAPYMLCFYIDHYEKMIRPLTALPSHANLNLIDAYDECNLLPVAPSHGSQLLTKACQTARVLYEVLKLLRKEDERFKHDAERSKDERLEIDNLDRKIELVHKKVEILAQRFKPYNILPFNPYTEEHAIMKLPEIKAAVAEVKNTVGLPQPKCLDHEDMLDWLQAKFKFQKDNVSNQREHLILLLSNVQTRLSKEEPGDVLDDRVLDEVLKKLLGNYIKWCKHLRTDSNCPRVVPKDNQPNIRQRKVLHIGLYLLIWGEAANLRFMPECLCYIYHHMAGELLNMLERRDEENKRQPVNFLEEIVTPIYQTIATEAAKERHSERRNYDDLNEYFWSAECLTSV